MNSCTYFVNCYNVYLVAEYFFLIVNLIIKMTVIELNIINVHQVRYILHTLDLVCFELSGSYCNIFFDFDSHLREMLKRICWHFFFLLFDIIYLLIFYYFYLFLIVYLFSFISFLFFLVYNIFLL